MIEDILHVFDFAVLRESLTIYKHLKNYDYTMDDLARHLEKSVEEIRVQEREVQKKKDRWENVAPKCPECGDVLVRPKKLCGKNVPTNEKGHSCHWFCVRGWNEDKPDDICGWERYTHENAMEITIDLMEGKLDGYNIP